MPITQLKITGVIPDAYQQEMISIKCTLQNNNYATNIMSAFSAETEKLRKKIVKLQQSVSLMSRT